MTASMYARFEKPINFYRGETMAGFCADEVKHDPNRGFVGGFYMETLALGPAFMGAFLEPGGWGKEITDMMDGYKNLAGMWLVGEDMPRSTNRVTLSKTEKDQYGMPAPNVHFHEARIKFFIIEFVIFFSFSVNYEIIFKIQIFCCFV